MTDQAPPKHPTLYKARAPARAAGRGWLHLARVDAEWRLQRGMAPFPLFRWAASIGILIGTAVASTDGVSGWWHQYGVLLIIAAAIAVGPEITRIEFGWMRMELLRETRAELRALNTQVSQLQIQEASAASKASAGITQTFHGVAAAVEVTAATKQGEETPPVPVQDVDWGRFTDSARVKPPSAGSGMESTVEE